jgi:hypothetical protein
MAIDPRHYLDVPSGIARYRADAQATAFLRKYEDLETSIDKEAAAVKSFYDSERACAETNYVLSFLFLPPTVDDSLDGARIILNRARKWIKRVIGRMPDELGVAFGPGTSFELKESTFTTVMDKLHVTPAVTPLCADIFAHSYWPSLWGRVNLALGRPLPRSCRGNRFTTVPKDGKTDRGIGIEPIGNLSCQLSIGRWLKRRLKRIGLNVDRSSRPKLNPLADLLHVREITGQTVHQLLAELASRTGEDATIDLTSASDTVSYLLVKLLFEEDWFRLLDSCRSPFTLIGGRWHRNEKFSSMGNGFTFELETLIFAALAHAVTGLTPGKDVFVYGDDIICPTKAAPSVIRVLKMFGFTPNVNKTFTVGSFRESCGGDYFNGWAVRPVFLKKARNTPCDWMSLHNELFRWGGPILSSKMANVLAFIRAQVPSHLRLSGPSVLGDSLFHTRAIRPKFKWERGIRFFKTCLVESMKIPLDRWSDEYTVTAALLGVSSAGVTPRDSVRGVDIGWLAHS